MPQINPNTIGAKLHFTAKIPADVARARAEQDGEHGSSELTPNWGTVPEIAVRKLRKAGVSVPAHWKDEDVIVPIIHGQAFYIGDIALSGGAVSFSMKGVNLRTGRPETDGPVSDDPSQSYWATGVYLPWIDGYVPADGQAVRQFVPLKGETEMAADVARHVGISDSDPYIDALRGRFFGPVAPKEQTFRVRGGGYAYDDGMVLESFSAGPDLLGASRRVSRGAPSASFAPSAPVGMGAGARMKQRHEHNPHVKDSDFVATPWYDVSFRLVWIEDWNEYAKQVGEQPVSDDTIEGFTRNQVAYETDERRRLGIFQNVDTNVGGFPTAP